MFKNNTVVQKFYFVAITMAIITLSVGVWHYWHNGSANIDNISKVFDASLKLQQIKKKKKSIITCSCKDLRNVQHGGCFVNFLEFVNMNLNSSIETRVELLFQETVVLSELTLQFIYG